MPLAAELRRRPPGGARRRVRDHRARAARDVRLRRAHRLARTAGVRRAARARARTCRPCSGSARATASRSSRAARVRASPAGALPVADGIVVSVARMNRILEVDVESERVVVQPGVTNLDVTRAVAAQGYFYAPDPSSQQVCTIGGNVAENSGGAHCLKHGFTVNHVTGAKVVLPDGELLVLGGEVDRRRRRPRPARRDRRLRGNARDRRRGDAPDRPPAGDASSRSSPPSRSIDAAGDAVSRIVAAGILPGAMEIMDRFTIQAAEEAYRARLPRGRRSGAPRRARRRHRRRSRTTPRPCRGDLPRLRGVRDPDGERRGRARAPLARAEGRVRGDGARLARLLRPGRRRAPDAAAGGAAADRRSSPRSTGSGSATSSTRATATSTRSSSTTRRPRASTSARRRSPTRSSPPASTPAAR